jgi:hypothetical protein
MSTDTYRRLPTKATFDVTTADFDDDSKYTKKPTWQRWLENIIWLAIGIATALFFDVYDALFDERVKRSAFCFHLSTSHSIPSLFRWPFILGAVGHSVFVCVFMYLQIYLPHFKNTKVDYKHWQKEIKQPIQMATVGGLFGFFNWLIAFWPVWGLSTLIVFLGMFMGVITLLGFF